MTDRVFPEAIRGAWFCLAEGVDASTAWEDESFEVFVFRLDSSFHRVVMRDGYRREQESGEYTFDGDFLITRGRTTETYRIKAQDVWRWELDGRKEEHALVRGLLDPSARPELDAPTARDLRILPVRAWAEPLVDNAAVQLYRLFYNEGGQADWEQDLAVVALERGPQGAVWAGITRLVSGLDDNAWRRLIVEGLLGTQLADAQPAPTSVAITFCDH